MSNGDYIGTGGYKEGSVNLYGLLASYIGLPFPRGVADIPDYLIKKNKNRAALIEQGITALPQNFWKGKQEKYNRFGEILINPIQIGEDDEAVIFGDTQGKMPFEPLMVINGSKNWTSTRIGGGTATGTVKQFIAKNDYQIKIYGFCISLDSSQYPLEQVTYLQDLWQVDASFKFYSIPTAALFEYIVIKNIKFEALTKSPGMQMYEILAESDHYITVEELRDV